MKRPPVVEVTWDDSATTDAWSGEIGDVCRIVTVGYLVKKSKRRIVVAMAVSETGRRCCQFAIPRGCVISVKRLT